jgi:hypothetical protein
VKEKPQPTVVDMPLAAVHAMPEVQPRVAGLHGPTVAEYRERHKAGDEFPPLVAYGTKRKAILSEGFHRHEVFRLEGVETVRVELRPGDQEAATLNALASNARHGLKRTNADKRAAVERMLALRPKWTDRRIADHCGVDHKTVSDVRKELVGKFPTSEPQQREGKDGRIVTVPPKDKPAKSTAAKDIGIVYPSGDDEADSQSEATADQPDDADDVPQRGAAGDPTGGLLEGFDPPHPDQPTLVFVASPPPEPPADPDPDPAPVPPAGKPKPPPTVDAWGIPIQEHAVEAFAAVPKFRELLAAIQAAQRLFNEVANLPGGKFLTLPDVSSYRRGKKQDDGGHADRFVHEGIETAYRQVKNAVPTQTVCPYQFAEVPHDAGCRCCCGLNWTPVLSDSTPRVCVDRAKAAFQVSEAV